ncbi:PKHD1L1, partial [Symbiodinium sp. CCMP2456]
FPTGWMAREGFQVLVRFRRPIGDVAPLEVHTTGFPAEFRLEVFTIEDGDADAIFLEKIPADLFQVPLPDPESETLQVVTEGIVGAFGGSEVLGYQYSHDLVPTIFSAQPTHVNATDHLTLVISGLQRNSSDGWVDDLQILIGDDAGLCGDLQEVQDSDNDTAVEAGITVICKLSDAAAGEHQVHLISVSQGKANPDTAPLISVDLVLEDFQPHFGSLAGGTLLRLSGSGVRNLQCSDVLVGGRQCSQPFLGAAPIASGKASLFCLTPPSASFDAADASTWVDAAMPVTIAQPPRSASVVRGEFVYKLGSTPIVQALSPAVQSAAVSATFLLQGSNLGSSDDEVALVRFGPREAKVIAQTSSALEVWLQRAAPEAPAEPMFEPSVWMSTKGFAAVVPGAVLESRFEVTSVGPLRASKAGGVVLSIAGAGFHPESGKHLISLSPADGAHALECLVIAGNSTNLDCRLQGSAAKIVAQQLPTEENSVGTMRRLSAKRQAPSRPLQCQAGADDRSKVRCFAKALANAGSVRSQPSETASGRVSEALDFLRRVEAADLAIEMGDAVFEDAVAMDGGYGDRGAYEDGYSSDGDGYGDQYDPVADPEHGIDDASRRLRDARASVPIEIQIRPRWGVESDAAEDFRLAHMRPIRKRRSRQRDPPAAQLPRRLMSEEDEDADLNDTSSDPNAAEETEVGSDDSDETEDSDGSKQVAAASPSDDSEEAEDSDGSKQMTSEGTGSSELGSDDSDEPEDSDGHVPAVSTIKPSTTKAVVPPNLAISGILDLNDSALEDFDANASDLNASDESDNLTEEDENASNSSNSSDLNAPTSVDEEPAEEAIDIDESFSLTLSLNGVRARCKAESGCGLVLSGQETPLLTAVSPLNGSYADGVDVELTLFSAEEPEGVSVRFGEQLCPDVQIRNLTEGGSWWSLSLPLCTFEASNVPIYVHTALGYALFASPFTGADFHFTQHLRLSSVYPLNGSFYGGTTITISGVGFGASPSMNLVTVGQVPCQVLSASYDEIRCLVPPAPEELQEEENRTKNITVRVMTASQDLQPGLRGEYFFFSQGSSLPSFDGRGADLVRVDPTLNFPRLRASWEGMSVSDHFAVRWTGFLRVHRAGMYRFFIGSDDGSQLFINGEMVINHDRLHGFSERSSLDTMFQGESVHMVTVLFFEKTGDAGCVLKYQGPDTGGEKIVVPAAVLSHARYQESPTLSYTYDAPEAAPMVEQLLEAPDGTEVVLQGRNFGVSGNVAIGTASNPATNFQCQTLNWTDTRVTCARPQLPSGVWQVRLFSDSYGWSNAAADGLWVGLHVASVEANGISVDADSDKEPWVLIMKFSDGEDLGYESPLWENTELLNADSPEGVPVNAKYPTYLDLPFTHLRACVGSPHGHCVHHRFATPWASARELFSTGYVRDSTVDQAGFVQAFGASPSSYRTCPMLYPGFNVECPHRNKARWGFCANCASKTCRDESEADAAVGIGLKGEGVHARGAGWTPLFASGAGSCSYSVDASQNVWLWVANATAE